jgi:hypothetical protein
LGFNCIIFALNKFIMDLQTMITELNEKLAPSGGSMQTKPDKYPPGHYLIFTATEGDEDENDPTTKIIDIGPCDKGGTNEWQRVPPHR